MTFLKNSSIDMLLAKRNTQRLGKSGSHDEAIGRLEISKLIASNYEGFNTLRKHLVHPKDQPKLSLSSREVRAAVDLLSDLGWIKPGNSGTWQISQDTKSSEFGYIKGNWLEEYVYCAHLAAGVDEATFGQEISWSVDGVTGCNEIDVIARRGDTLSFTSCKTQSPFPSNGASTQLTGFLTEVHYWDSHFANNQGKLLLAVTADFIDEMQKNRHRYPQVVARASIMDIGMIGLEDLRWERVIEEIGHHWNS